jgi:flagellar hook assembly protein FlgD
VRTNPYRAASGPLVVRWSLAQSARVSLDVLDLQGRHVATVGREAATAGEHESRWDGHDEHGAQLPPAMYVLRLTTPSGMRSRRIVLVR